MGPNMVQPDSHLLDIETDCRGDECGATIIDQVQSFDPYGADVQCPECGFWQWVKVYRD